MPNYFGNNPMYIQELQSMRDRIDRQMSQLQQNQTPQMQPPITQNFQLAPNSINNELESKYVNNYNDVKNTFVMKTGIFTNRDFSTIWVKDVTGNIRTFNTEEVIELDEKDKEILNLQKQLNELKGMITNADKSQYNNSISDESNGNATTKGVSTNKKSNAK